MADENWSSGNCTFKEISFDSVGHLSANAGNNYAHLNETMFAEVKHNQIVMLLDRWTLEPLGVRKCFLVVFIFHLTFSLSSFRPSGFLPVSLLMLN